MGILELRLALVSLAETYRASGAASPATDLERVACLLNEDVHDSVSDLAEEIAVVANPKHALAAELLRELNIAGADRTAFDPVLARIKTSKEIDKALVEQIASDYIGVQRTWKSKKAAIDEIEATFVSRAYQANKMKIVGQYKGW